MDEAISCQHITRYYSRYYIDYITAEALQFVIIMIDIYLLPRSMHIMWYHCLNCSVFWILEFEYLCLPHSYNMQLPSNALCLTT